MTRYLLFYMLLAAISVASVRGTEPSLEKLPYLVRVGLVADDPVAPAAVPEEAKSCDGVTLTRNLRYGESEQNVLDIATGSYCQRPGNIASGPVVRRRGKFFGRKCSA
jgi:hypothetical protein